MRKDSAIQEKAGENEALAEEKRRQEEESENTVERMQLAHSVEADQLVTEHSGEIEDLRVELELKESLAATKDALVNSKETRITR